jgi:hypothetical protein
MDDYFRRMWGIETGKPARVAGIEAGATMDH